MLLNKGDLHAKYKSGVLRKILILVCMLVYVAELGFALDGGMTIITPYIGRISHTYQNENPLYPKLSDTGMMYGLFAQHLKKDKFLANAFIYYANDVNYSYILGMHAIFDKYFNPTAGGKWVVGLGTEYIGINLDAGSSLLSSGLEEFQMDLSIFAPFVRAGRYFNKSLGQWRLSILPWLGGIWEAVRGEVGVKPSAFSPLVTIDAKDDQYFCYAGLNVSVWYRHFLRLKAKYNYRFNKSSSLQAFSAQVEFLLSKNWGISYRFKYNETTQGEIGYHIFGITWMIH